MTSTRAARLFHNLAQQALKYCMNNPRVQEPGEGSIGTIFEKRDGSVVLA